MMGSFITRGLVMILGYTYPAYECFKTVEKNKPEIENLRFWCQYWIIAAMLTVLERFGDAFISWVPMYDEAKLAFFIYLWYPRTKGTTYVYKTFLRPYLSKHETEIDHNLLELRVRAGDMAVLYWQKAASYGQTRFFEILQYASQSSSPRPLQQQQQTSPQHVRPSRVASAAHQPVGQQGEQAPPQGGGISLTKQKQGPVRDAIIPSSQAPVAPQAKQPSPQPRSPSASQAQGQPQRTSSGSAVSGTQQMPSPSTVPPPLPSDAGKAPAGTALAVRKDGNAPVSEDAIIEESIRVTRGRLRRIRGIGKQNGV